jgi:hypothetical protein
MIERQSDHRPAGRDILRLRIERRLGTHASCPSSGVGGGAAAIRHERPRTRDDGDERRRGERQRRGRLRSPGALDASGTAIMLTSSIGSSVQAARSSPTERVLPAAGSTH